MKAMELLKNIVSSCSVSVREPDEKFLKKKDTLLKTIEDKEILDKMNRYIYEFIYMPIYNILDESEREVFNNTVVDSVSVPKINASALKTDEDEFLIIITGRLMGLLHTWNEIQIKIALNEKITNDEAAQAFAPIIDSYLTPNSNYALPIFSLEELSLENAVLATLKTAMHEKFIIAHEMAHIYLGHLKDLEGISNYTSEYKMANFYEKAEDINKEYEADVQAVKWLSRFEDAKVALTMYVEALVAFHYIECNVGFPKSDSSHPASLLRLINLKEKCSEYFKDCTYSLEEMIRNCIDIESFIIKPSL